MKKLLFFFGLLWAAGANAQFTPGQLLTAGALNAQFALYAPLAGATFTGPVSGTTFAGAFNGPLNGSVGATTPSTGSFTNLSSNGTLTLPNGSVVLPYLATESANTVVANFTGSTASPVAFSMPSCTGSSNALGYTSGTGIVCNGSINASSLGGAVAASYALLASPTFTGTPAAPTASATTNTTQIATTAMVNSAITGNNLAGAFTTLTASSTITPSQTAGIVGTTTNNNANAGSVGEFQPASSTATSITSGTTVNATSISLGAGDWNCWGQALFLPAASTVIANIAAGITTTSATLPGSPDSTYLGTTLTTGTNGATSINTVMKRFSLSSTTTIYVVALAGSVTVSTATVNGYVQCRRVR